MQKPAIVAWLIAALLCFLPVASMKATAAEPNILSLAWLANNDPQAALEQTDAALADLQVSAEPDVKLVFDLYRLKADLLFKQGRLAEAAQTVATLAKFAVRHRAVLNVDPVPLMSEAANLFEGQGDYRSAGRIVTDKLDEQRNGGWSGETLARTLEDLARLSDLLARPDDAQGYRTAAAEARANNSIDPSRSDDQGFSVVDVYYATDRARTGDSEPAEFYGHERGALELGIATVTIPNLHTAGLIEAPSIWRLEFSPSPAKHVVLRSVTPVETVEFYSRLSAEFDGTGKDEAFVFIHGFNVRFDQATKRAAQIAYDMEYQGVPIVYSWPSYGSTVRYVADTAVVQLSARRLTHFLDGLVDRSGATTIHIVAHSMGNRALTEALELMALRRGVKDGDDPVLGQVLFAAPDVDAGLFAAMIPTIRPLAQRLTLYASEEDWALVTSRKLHGGAPRAGQGGEDTLAIPQVDSIDMSELGEDMLAHSYFADDSSALLDMMALFWRNAQPMRRCGLQEARPDESVAVVWRYRRGQCGGQQLINLFAELRREGATDASDIRAIMERLINDAGRRAELEPLILKIVAE